MFNIHTSEQFRALCPTFKGVAVHAEVTNGPSSQALWNVINEGIAHIMAHYTTETLKQRESIAATRAAYRTFGKDPSRYRPSCEQLARRVLQGKGLYRVDTLVDLTNLVSLLSGYSIGAIDAAKIVGNDITLDVGRAGEPYEGIGRGILNIEHLPAYRDAVGAFATPTSDSTRTMLSPTTTHLLVLINGYDGNLQHLTEAGELTIKLLKEYAAANMCNMMNY